MFLRDVTFFSRHSHLVLLCCSISLGQSGWPCQFYGLINHRSLVLAFSSCICVESSNWNRKLFPVYSSFSGGSVFLALVTKCFGIALITWYMQAICNLKAYLFLNSWKDCSWPLLFSRSGTDKILPSKHSLMKTGFPLTRISLFLYRTISCTLS